MPGPFALSSTDAVVTALTGGGLSGVEVTRVTAPFPVATLDQWWDRVVKLAGPLAQAMAAMEPDVREAIHERALAKGEAAARETADGLEFTGSVLVGSGQRS
jgi:hypothetical protein